MPVSIEIGDVAIVTTPSAPVIEMPVGSSIEDSATGVGLGVAVGGGPPGRVGIGTGVGITVGTGVGGDVAVGRGTGGLAIWMGRGVGVELDIGLGVGVAVGRGAGVAVESVAQVGAYVAFGTLVGVVEDTTTSSPPPSGLAVASSPPLSSTLATTTITIARSSVTVPTVSLLRHHPLRMGSD